MHRARRKAKELGNGRNANDDVVRRAFLALGKSLLFLLCILAAFNLNKVVFNFRNDLLASFAWAQHDCFLLRVYQRLLLV